MKIRIEKLTNENFNAGSLDYFVRHQIVKECWRYVDGEWKLLPISFTENWNLENADLLPGTSPETWMGT